jgi:hypothetical protein
MAKLGLRMNFPEGNGGSVAPEFGSGGIVLYVVLPTGSSMRSTSTAQPKWPLRAGYIASRRNSPNSLVRVYEIIEIEFDFTACSLIPNVLDEHLLRYFSCLTSPASRTGTCVHNKASSLSSTRIEVATSE